MPLNTRCNRCGRLFPVYAQQLKKRGSKVECPQCGGRFNAVAGLLEEAIPGEPVQKGGRKGQGREASATAPAALLTFDDPVRKRLGASSFLWLTGVLLLTAGLLIQGLWWERGTLLQYPQARAVADAVCAEPGCELPLPRQAGTMEILQPTLIEHPENRGVLLLHLTLINGADILQRLPLLQIELFDRDAKMIAARRLPPELYLPGPPQGRGLPPGSAKNVMLELASPPTPPSDFRLELF